MGREKKDTEAKTLSKKKGKKICKQLSILN